MRNPAPRYNPHVSESLSALRTMPISISFESCQRTHISRARIARRRTARKEPDTKLIWAIAAVSWSRPSTARWFGAARRMAWPDPPATQTTYESPSGFVLGWRCSDDRRWATLAGSNDTRKDQPSDFLKKRSKRADGRRGEDIRKRGSMSCAFV